MLKSICNTVQSIAQEFNTPTQANNKDLKFVQNMYQSSLSYRIGGSHPGFDYDVRLVPSKAGLAPLSFVAPSAPGRKDTVASFVPPSFRAKPAIEVTKEFFANYSSTQAGDMMENLTSQIIDHSWNKKGQAAQRVAFDESYTGEKLPAAKTNG